MNSFPLIQSAMRLYNFHDSMIRTCVRTIVMTVLKIKYDKIQDHFTQLPSVEYFIFIVLHLRDLVLDLDSELNNGSAPRYSILSNLIGDILDEILYISDLFQLQLKKINYVLMNSLFATLIMPLLCESLVTKSKPRISISLSIFLLILLIENIKDESFCNVLFTVLLSDKRSHDLIEYFKQPKDNKNYMREWRNDITNGNTKGKGNTNHKEKKSNISFIDFISNNYSEGFLMSLMNEKNIFYSTYHNFNELKEINKKIKAKSKDNSDPSSPFSLTSREIQKIVLDSFTSKEIQEMKEYHKSVGTNIGLTIGLYSHTEVIGGKNKFESGFMFEMMKYYQISKLQYVDKSHLLFSNEIKANLFSYLESKDDTLLLLVSMMLFFTIEKNIAPFLISEAKLINYNKAKVSSSNQWPNGNNDLLYLNSLFANDGLSNSINDVNVSFKSFIFDNRFFVNMSNDSIKPDLALIENLIKVKTITINLI